MVAIGWDSQRQSFARHELEEVLDVLAHPGQGGDGTRRSATRVLAVGHERYEIPRLCQRGEIVAGAPTVLKKAVIRGRPGVVFGAVDDGDAQSKSTAVKCARCFAIPGGEEIAILDIHVLDVELDSPESILLTQLDQTARRPATRRGISEEASKCRLIERP